MKKTFLTGILVLCGIFAYASETSPSAQPAPRDGWAGPHSGWYTKLASQLKGKNIDILILGDSINMAWQTPIAKRGGGKEVWDEHFWKYSTTNFALAGDRTEHLLWRITEGKQVDGYKTKLIILMIGINNAHQVRPGAKNPDTPRIAAEGVKNILQTIRQKQPDAKILLIGALPAHFNGCNLLNWTDEFNRLIAVFADDETIFFKDFRKEFMKDEKTLNQDIFIDGIHLNEKGFRVYASLLEPLIAKNVPAAEPRSAQSVPGNQAWKQWCDFISSRIAKNAGKTFDIVLFGDNQLWGFGQAKGQKAWQENMRKYSTLNIAYVNDRTEQLIYRVNESHHLNGYRARLIVIQAGMANAYAGNLVDTPVSAAYGVAKLVELIRKAQPDAKILILGGSAIHYPGNNLIPYGAELDRRLEKLADNKNVYFKQTASFALNPDKTLKKELYDNGFAFNSAGYEAFVQEIKPQIDLILTNKP